MSKEKTKKGDMAVEHGTDESQMVEVPGLKEWLEEGKDNAKFWMRKAQKVALSLASKSQSGEITEDDLLCELEIELYLTERHTLQVFKEMVEERILEKTKTAHI